MAVWLSSTNTPASTSLAKVKGVDYIELEKELMAIETEKEPAPPGYRWALVKETAQTEDIRAD